MITDPPSQSDDPADDPADDTTKHWVTLAVLMLATVIVILDGTTLTVALPSLIRDFDTSLASLQWVLSAYALTFATLLIIAGKMADLYGPRRMFMVGLAIFAIGSFIASISQSAGQMIFGGAIVKGVGASLVLPAAAGILTTRFRGKDRAMAYGAWGSAVGAGAAFGPLIGGYFTTYHSWRWAFRINVLLAPLALLIALAVMRRDGAIRRARFDLVGALFLAVGSFALVFGLSQGPTYGWWEPLTTLSVNGAHAWPADRPVSIIPLLLVISVAVFGAFVGYERRRDARGVEALFPLAQLRHRGFRNGLLAALLFTAGTVGFMLVIVLYLQQNRHLSAMSAGAWLLPYGISSLVGAQVAGRVTRAASPVPVIRAGATISLVGTITLAFVLSPSTSFLALVPAMVMAGVGNGIVNTQLTSVILVDIDPGYGSVAGATASTMRQLGAALAIAGIGAVFATAGGRQALLVVSGALALSTVAAHLIPRHIGQNGGADIDIDITDVSDRITAKVP